MIDLKPPDHVSPDTLIRDYQRTGQTVRWPIDPELQAAVKVSYRSRLAATLADASAAEINRRYVYLTDRQMQRMLDLLAHHVLDRPLAGVGIELGSGSGLLAAVSANQPGVTAVLALEVCENFDVLIRKVAASVLGDQAHKVIPVVGSFDDLRLPDASLDFAIEHDSLHHSDDLARTITACSRVLKPGGRLICFDRCHPDSLTDQEVARMLDHVYSAEFLAAMSYPTDIIMTRRENGEHEYRLFEWKAAAEAAGMDLIGYCDFTKQIHFKLAAKSLLAMLPRSLRQRYPAVGKLSLATSARWVRQRMQRLGAHPPVLAPKSTNVLVLQKRDPVAIPGSALTAV